MKKFRWLLLLIILPFVVQSKAAPVLVLQEGGDYFGMVSNGGRWIINGNQIFDGRSGLQWGELPTVPNLSVVCFTPDATRVLMAEKVEPAIAPDYWRVALCEMPSGRKLRWFSKAVYPFWCDNARFRGIESGVIVEFDFKSGRKKSVKLQNPPDESNKLQYSFSENGRFLIEGESGVIRWWNTADGRLRGRINDETRSGNSTAISNDGKLLSSQHEEYGRFPEGIHYTLGQADFKIYIWNAKTRRVQRTLSVMGVADFKFSTDGRFLLSHNLELHRFDLRTGKDYPPLSGKEYPARISLSQDWKWLAGANDSQGIQLWSLQSNKRVAAFHGPLPTVDKLKWSPDGKYLAALVGQENLILWDAHTGKIISRLNSYVFDFSWVNASTIRSQTLGSMQTWSVPDLKLKSTFDFSPPRKDDSWRGYSDGLSIAPDGRTILTADNMGYGERDELLVWDVATKKLQRKIKIEGAYWGYTDFEYMLWLPDNRRVLISLKNRLLLLDTQTGKIEKEQNDPVEPRFEGFFRGALQPLSVSPDGKWLAVFAVRNKETIVFDLKDWSINPVEGIAWWKKTYAAGKLPAAPRGGGEISSNGRLIAYSDRSHAYEVVGNRALVASQWALKGVSIWSVAARREVVRLYVDNNVKGKSPDWIALTPEGYYDATPNGEKRLRWREGSQFWPLAKSRARFKRPDIIARALNPH